MPGYMFFGQIVPNNARVHILVVVFFGSCFDCKHKSVLIESGSKLKIQGWFLDCCFPIFVKAKLASAMWDQDINRIIVT